MPIHIPYGVSYSGIYEVHQYRYENSVTVWVGRNGKSKRSRTIWLKLWIWRSPAERIKTTRERYQRLADKWNHKEMFLAHEVELTERN